MIFERNFMINNQENTPKSTAIEANATNCMQNQVNIASEGDSLLQNHGVFAENSALTGQNDANFVQDSVENAPNNNTDNSKTGDPVSVIQQNNANLVDNSKQDNTILSKNDDDSLFSALFPGMTREKAENDKNFKLFMNSRRDGVPLALLYSEYKALESKIEEEAIKKEAARLASKHTSVGSLSSSEPISSDFFTKEQVLKMSKEQISKNYDKIRQSQAKW